MARQEQVIEKTETFDNPLLEIKGLSKAYDDFQLQDVDLILPAGTIMGFLGRNGAGKSTTIKTIMDFIKPDAGEIRIFGMLMSEHEVEIKDQIGYVGDTLLLDKTWTVERTLRFVRHFYRKWDQQMVEAYLKQFSISPEKKISQLSKGMKVKFSLLLAMAHKPKLLLLDEPTSGLDPVAREEVLDLLLDFVQDEDCGVLFSSHITSDVEKIADWVTIIDQGHIFVSEDRESLLDRYRRIVIAGNGTETIDDHPFLMNCKPTRGGYVGYTDRYDEFQRVAAGEWHSERLTLEELFVLLVGRKEE